MCGIAGILAFEPDAPFLRSDLILRMRDVMAHRGPDGVGVFHDSHVALGQRRLSIIDLAGGAQPMSNTDESIWVLNNGEIYDYQQLRHDLELQGFHFRTDSDTEVIVHGYCAYGSEIVKHLRGMFAAAIWDVPNQRLLLARDRAGKKPLYYAHLPEGLFFASEIKALLHYESMPRELDEQALADYFTYQSIPDPLTIFKQIKKLPPAHFLTCDTRGNLQIQRYWRWSLAENQHTTLAYEDAVVRVRDLLQESVRLRMIADVPLGALLSGGVDSSAVVAMMTGRVKTFSIGFSAAAYDERSFAREVAEFCGTEHEELLVEPENIRDVLPKLAWQYDEPLGDVSALPTYYVCKMARQKVTVALAGDGGDEVFAGYSRYDKFIRLTEQFQQFPLAWRQHTVGRLTHLLPTGILTRPTLRLIGTSLEERYQRMNTLFEEHDLRRLLPRHKIHAPRPLYAQRFDEFSTLPLLSRLQLADFELYMTSTVLVKVDRASMLNSLEVRAPLLDQNLLDFVGTLPPEWRMGKRILKDAIRGLVPDTVLNRPKMGFGVPLEHWFSGGFGDFLREILLDKQTQQRGILNPAEVEKLIQRQAKPYAELTHHLWLLLMFELWCRDYL
ncbi:MAG: asparagine synthase (glutamine-hydrolyzing) [Anaerolineae bacterium]|nr:asparagine synthase (glutamine-hydrolyzing) [Anaerolineae bacterium]